MAQFKGWDSCALVRLDTSLLAVIYNAICAKTDVEAAVAFILVTPAQTVFLPGVLTLVYVQLEVIIILPSSYVTNVLLRVVFVPNQPIALHVFKGLHKLFTSACVILVTLVIQ
jgi:hypothetical protein